MTNTVRNLIRDLIERRLWPVALLLAVALAAVPVVLGHGGSDAASTAALPATPATGAAPDAEKAEVTLDTTAPADSEPGEHVRNPFKSPARPKAKTASTETSGATPSATASAPAPAASTPAATPSPSTSGSSTSDPPATTTAPATGTTKPKTTTKPNTTTAPRADDPSDTYHVSVRFGLNGGKTKTIRDIARLSALPSVTDPFFVYLGVIETTTTHEKRAVFLVSSDATPNGEGACHPTKTDCESVELAVGQTAFFDYTLPTGVVTQYQLELAGIHKTAVVSDAKASAAFARHSVAGAELLGDAATRNVRAAAGARAYRYVPGAGLLVRAKRKHVTAKAVAVGTQIPGITLLSRKLQPGIAVWHSPKR
jgi:hypothetical protein